MAGQIPRRFIDQLIDRVDIVELIDSRVRLRKAGKDYTACCPFHDEKTPSFSVIPDKQFYYCFGCGATGNAIGFLMDYERLEFVEAVEKLAAIVGVEVPREGADRQQGDAHRALYEMLTRVDRWYQNQLRDSEHAMTAVEYLKRRGISGETARDFGLGFAPPGWSQLISALGDSDENRRLLLHAGLLITRDDGGYYDRFRERIMFPIRDGRGRTIAFGGRVLGDDKPKYLNSPETAVFHKGRELYGRFESRKFGSAQAPLLVVEGYMDVIMLAQYGIREAVATLGTALTEAHLGLLFRDREEIVICFDGDEAGRRAADRALQLLLGAMQDGRQARFLFLPEGDDPDSLVRRIGANAFRKLIADAPPLSEQLFEQFSAQVNLDSADGRARLAKLLLPAINRIPGPLFRSLMLEELARRSRVPKEELNVLAVGNLREQHVRTRHPEPARSAQRKRRTSGLSLIEQATALVLRQPSLAADVERPDDYLALAEPYIELFVDVCKKFQMAPETRLGSLLGYWYGTPEGTLLGNLAAIDLPGGLDSRAQEFSDLLARLDHRLATQRAERLRRELEQIPFEQWSPEQKAQYRELVHATRGPNTGTR